MGKKKKIKNLKSQQSDRIIVPDVINYDTRPPVFSLERLTTNKPAFERMGKVPPNSVVILRLSQLRRSNVKS